jgi:hypothetical protein
MAFQFAPDPETYEADVVDPGAAATGTAVGGGVGAGIGALIGGIATSWSGGWGVALGAGIGASLGAPIGTAVGTSVGTETKEFPVGAGPQAIGGMGGGGGLNLDSFAWEKLFEEMDGLDSGVVSPPSGEAWAHTMLDRAPPGPGYGVAPPAGFGVELDYGPTPLPLP